MAMPTIARRSFNRIFILIVPEYTFEAKKILTIDSRLWLWGHDTQVGSGNIRNHPEEFLLP